MKNFFLNPNQRLDSLFNLDFTNLGGFENIVNNQNVNEVVDVKITMDIGNAPDFISDKNVSVPFDYELILIGNGQTSLAFSWSGLFQKIDFSLPSTLKSTKKLSINGQQIIWNGLTFAQEIDTVETYILCSFLNGAYNYIRNIEIIPPKRGFSEIFFSKFQFTSETKFTPEIFNGETGLESRVGHFFKQIFDKSLIIEKLPGIDTGLFRLKVRSQKGLVTDIVNEGYGVNSALYILLHLLKQSTSLAFIEEPEIHLHPSAQAKLVDVFAEIIQKENKQIFLTTHSENIVSSVLAKIAKGELDKNDVQFYLAKNEDDETKIIPQEVNDKGQIEGGLMSFMETELSNLKTLLGI